MKKLITFVVALVVVLGIWWKYSSYVKGIKNSVQGDPVRTVNTFMDTTVKFSNLLWNEEEKEAFLSDMEQWKKSGEEGKEEAPKFFEKYGLENPSPLFEKKEYGKAAAGLFCLYQFGSFSVEKKDIEEKSATIEVKFLPEDFLGLGKTMAKLGVPQQERKKEPISVPFHLKKHQHRWYIVDIRGELGEAIEATYRLRKLR